MLSSEPHDEFLELCAVSTTGHLSEEEQNRLREHLAVCSPCREALRQYEAVVDRAIPPLVTEEEIEHIDPGPGWSQAKAEKALFQRLAREEERQAGAEPSNGIGAGLRHALPVAPESTWRHVWMLCAAGIMLFITLGLCAYWFGLRRGTQEAKAPSPAIQEQNQQPALASTPSLEEQLSDAAHERMIARQQIAARDQALAELRQQLARQSAEINQMKEAEERLESDLRNGESGREDLVRQRSELAQKLDAAQTESQALKQQMASLARQSGDETAHARTLEAKVKELSRLLENRDASLRQQEDLLAHDRDIRELMGARDLYIAEVYDVADDGATRKPYGRVFYTKGKSLIFYAYDLDQQQIRRVQAAAFQAWGRRGPDFKQALNLGIFYEDNASKKRWVLKLDDPKTLAQVDAVFVTVEPHGGSEKPSSKPLLFAYLRVNPNHP